MEVTKENQSQKKEGEQVDRQDEELDAEHGRVNVMLGRGATFQRTAPTDTSPCHLDMGDHVVEYPEHLENLCPDDKAYTQEDTNADRFHKDGGATHGQQHQTDFASRADGAVPNPLHTSTTDRAIEMLRMMTSSKVCWVALGCGLLVIASVVTAAILASLLITKEKVTHNEGEPDIGDIVKVSASPSWWTTFYKNNSSDFPTSTLPDFSSTPFKDVNECVARPCGHGNCANYAGGYECTCLPGWTGQNCQQDVNECTTSPCQHGSCANKDGGYDCNCHHGWTGTNCQQAIPCNSGWSEYNNHCYKLFKDKVSWSTANERCKQHGANLASVGSAGENNFIARLITDGRASPPLAGPRRHLAEIRWEGGISKQVVDL
ncbi:hypothetical protein Bbelb_084390 [Branchiostoma belcheri]|nr:hypothetical protein Bbelb_084390 [Branchiostoma belcheri]